MNLYDTIANLLEKNVINPDMVIYLQADTDTLVKNINKRQRTFEVNISYEYINTPPFKAMWGIICDGIINKAIFRNKIVSLYIRESIYNGLTICKYMRCCNKQ